MEKIISKLYEQIIAGLDSILITIIDQVGSTPRGLGTQMLVGDTGLLAGTVGGGSIEKRAIEHGMQLLSENKFEICDYDLGGSNKNGLGMACGGGVTLLFNPVNHNDAIWKEVTALMLKQLQENINGFLVQNMESGSPSLLDDKGEVLAGKNISLKLDDICYDGGSVDNSFVLPLAIKQRVIVCGGGHVAQCLVPVLASIDFRVTVLESRPEFARKELFPQASEVILGDYNNLDSCLDLKKSDFFAIMTHGHVHDCILQEQLLRKEYAYIGVMGSKRKIASVNARLLEAGISKEKIDSVHTPIGVTIGAVTPAEIAISIAAECIAVRASLRKKSTNLCPSNL